MLLNPGMIYYFGSFLLLFINNKKCRIISVIIPAMVLFSILFLPKNLTLSVKYLDFELILYEYNHIGTLIATIFTVIGLISMIYSFNIASKSDYILSNLYIGSSVSILFVGDFFSFLILWELMVIFSFFLIFNKNNKSLQKSSYYYFIVQIISGLSLLIGILLQYTNTGNIKLVSPQYGIVFFMLAVGIKLAFIGLHTWLPQNYSNVPFHISIILSAYTTKVGVYSFYRFFNGFNPEYLGIITAILAVFLALKQIKIRKILSYHLISQTGYMITGISLSSELGTGSGIFHLINHILYKGLLFMAAGAVIYTTGKEKLTSLGNLYKKLPLTMISALIGSLAISGFPFFNGYVSKLLLKKSAVNNTYVTYGLLIASIGTALSFAKIMYYTFFRKQTTKINRKIPKNMKIAMMLSILLILFIGINPSIFENLFHINFSDGYFNIDNIIGALIPIFIAGLLFVFVSDIIEPKENKPKIINFSQYFVKIYNWISNKLSVIHNGHLVRYLLWMLSTLIILWFYFLFSKKIIIFINKFIKTGFKLS